MTVIQAKHPGVCRACLDTFDVSEPIRRTAEGWVHDVCPSSRPPRPVCGECFMEISLNGACGCGVLT